MSQAKDEVTLAGGAAETSCDAFLDGRFKAYQPLNGPRAAIDALFLAAAIPARAGGRETVLEAGLGVGVASLALAARVSDARVTGVEVQPGLCSLARENIALNGMDERIAVVEANLASSPGILKDAGLVPGSFSHVAANPPFLTRGHARVSPDRSIAKAHAADEGALEDWIKFLTRMAGKRASLTLIHRADALDTLLGLLKGKFGGLTVFPLFPRAGAGATRIIVCGTRGSRAPLELARGMVLHRADGGYSDEANAVLRDGEPLTAAPAR